ncbi:MAG: gamma carbonic anhydrase family protein [Bacteroidia bacterium]|nr:gamma carbonic anhydrase family protein [Bacteroidia bacterium]
MNQFAKEAVAAYRYTPDRHYKPQKGQGTFIAPTATVVGRVRLGNQCSVWYGAVLRGDEEDIIVGDRTNIQDNCILHADPGEPTIIGQACIIGHGAVVHGAEIGDNTLIGIRATVLNRAKIGAYCLIGAHTLVTQDMEIPDYSLVLGTPGRVVKRLPREYMETFERGAQVYVDLAKDYLEGKFLEIERS